MQSFFSVANNASPQQWLKVAYLMEFSRSDPWINFKLTPRRSINRVGIVVVMVDQQLLWPLRQVSSQSLASGKASFVVGIAAL